MSGESAPLPPEDDAERAVVSALIIDPSAYGRVCDFLIDAHFHSGAHQKVAEALAALWKAGTPIDVVSVAGWLKSQSWLNVVGGMGYLTEVLLATPAPANVRAHALLIHDAWRRREAYKAMAHALAAIEAGRVQSTDGHLDQIASSLLRLANDRPDRPALTNGQLCERYLREIGEGMQRAAEGQAPRYVPTGIGPLDEHCGGLGFGEKTTLVALSRVGKTQAAIQVAVNAASQGLGVLFYSTELTNTDVAAREIAHVSRIASDRLASTRYGVPRLSPAEVTRLFGSVPEYRRLPIFVDDRSTVTIDQIRSDVAQWKEKFFATFGAPLAVVIIDYVQRLSPPPHMLRQEKNKQISYATTEFTKLLKEHDLAGFELAQQATPKGKSPNDTPDLYDVADDKTIVKEAHKVLYLYRPFANNDKRVNLALLKFRGGKEQEWALDLDGSQSRFTEAE